MEWMGKKAGTEEWGGRWRKERIIGRRKGEIRGVE